MELTVLPLLVERKEGRFDVYQALVDALSGNKAELRDGDIVVISTKYVSNAQGRILELGKVRASEEGIRISKRFQLGPKVAEVVIRESDRILGGIAGFLIAESDNIMAPNAGIDRSNAKKGEMILYPKDPFRTAEEIRRKIFLNLSVHVGIILVDSRLMPARVGTTGVAVSCAGLEPVLDMRAKRDLEGNPLKVTLQAVADNLATVANHKMGEGAESRPFAIIRDSGANLTDRKINPSEMVISPDQCVYVRGLANSP